MVIQSLHTNEIMAPCRCLFRSTALPTAAYSRVYSSRYRLVSTLCWAVRCDVLVLLMLELIYALECTFGQILRVPGRARRASELQSPPLK